jgi:hypothetical protein
MRRINVLAMVAFAALALSASAVSSASAAPPELIRAGKPGEVVKGEIRGESQTHTVLETENNTKVTCEDAKAKGGKAVTTKEFAGTKFLFTGCVESAFKGKCNTKGKGQGEIETAETVGLIGFEPGSSTQVDLELRPKATTSELRASFALFECAGGFAKIETRGAVIGMLGFGELNKSTVSLELVYAKGVFAGEQELTEMEGGFMTTARLESSVNRGTFEHSNQQGEGLVEFAEEVELT